MSDSYTPLLKLVLPDPLADYFELTSHRQKKEFSMSVLDQTFNELMDLKWKNTVVTVISIDIK